MKVVLKEPGFETYTGLFGVIEFVNGVSVRDVTSVEAERLGNIVRIAMEDGINPSSTQRILDVHGNMAPVEKSLATPEPAPVATPAPAGPWTEASLAAVADEKGIGGLREIAEPLGVRGRSISELIAAILTRQKGE